ncbi:MAG: M50 family metallopeptidase [Rickettsiales bacterium]|jgi:regulator of sigma E protease|nr:M50 family metallopeptidase [Rickettsiales bacterium]
MIYSIAGFLIVLGLVISIHEAGHFFAARWAGVKVNIFSIGFGRPIFKWRDRRGTEWRIAWLPLGGFVSIYGQEDMFERRKFKELPAQDKIGHYLSAPAWKQAVIVGAGIFMNLALAFAIYAGQAMGTQKLQMPTVGEIAGGGNCTEGGKLCKGDRIMQVGGKKVSTWEEMLWEKELGAGRETALIILRGKNIMMPKMPPGKWGIAPDPAKIETVRNGFFTALGKGARELRSQSQMVLVILRQMISGERSSKQLGGFLTIAEMSGRAISAGFAALLAVIALLSVNLGVINLFPLPVLDGGHLLILAIEAATRRKLQGRAMESVMRAGWWLLAALMAFALWNDIARILEK